MALQITLVKAPAAISITKSSHLFDRRGGTLGRGEANLWVLPDPEKFLSACHCELLFEAGGYYLLDLSTNGTFLNGAFEPIGKGSRLALTHGDFFDVGEYRFSVSLTDDQPFGVTPSDVFPATSESSFGVAVAAPIPLSPFDDAGLSLTDFPTGLATSQDPLAAFDKASKVKAPGEDALFGQPIFGSNLHKPGTESGLLDLAPSMDQAISWPSASRESLIPEDWEDDADLSDDPFAFASSGDEPAGHHNQRIKDFPSQDKQAFAESTPNIHVVTQARPPINPVRELEERAMVNGGKADVQAVVLQASHTQPAAVDAFPFDGSPQVTPPQVSVPRVPVPRAAAQKESTGNDILIKAMGLNPDTLTGPEIDEISEKVGILMREITEGMMQVLRSRTSIKNEFRMNVTTIQPVENNPLKFSVGVDEAMENMFLKKTNAYKKPSEAFREGFQEIGEHQVAMIAGIRHGFEKMMDRFNPDNLEAQFNRQIKGMVIPGMQKARHWNSYKEHYQNYSDNMESSFQHLFGSDFVTAYEDQLRKLIAVRKKNKS